MRFPSVLLAACLIGCASPARLSKDTQPVVVCIFDILKATSNISEPSVYAFEDSAIIVYKRHGDSYDIRHMWVQRRPLDNRFIATGDYIADTELGASLSSQIESKCQIETGYTDQVWVTENPRHWLLDMSRLKNKN